MSPLSINHLVEWMYHQIIWRCAETQTAATETTHRLYLQDDYRDALDHRSDEVDGGVAQPRVKTTSSADKLLTLQKPGYTLVRSKASPQVSNNTSGEQQ